MVTVEIWVMDVLTMPLHLTHSDLPLTTTLPLVGLFIILMHLRFLTDVTTSMKFWSDYIAFEWSLCLFPKFGASFVFFIGSSVSYLRFTCITVVLCVVARRLFPFGFCCFERAMDRHSSSASTVPSLDDDFEHNIWNPLLNLLFLEQVSCIFASKLVDIDLARIALSCHFALDLLCYKEDVFGSA